MPWVFGQGDQRPIKGPGTPVHPDHFPGFHPESSRGLLHGRFRSRFRLPCSVKEPAEGKHGKRESSTIFLHKSFMENKL